MNGLKLQIPYAVTDTSIPKLYNDEVMSDGSILLLDASRITTALVNGNTYDNIAYSVASNFITGATSTELAPVLTIGGGVLSDTGKIIERTGKNGIHTIVSKINDVNGTSSLSFALPTKIKAYLLANPNNEIYVSVWSKNTRGGSLSSSPHYFGSSTSVYTHILTDAGRPDTGVRRLGALKVPNDGTYFSGTSNKFFAFGFKGSVGAITSGTSGYAYGAGRFGIYGGAMVNTAASEIFYKVYMEDMTVSGRNFAEVSALDKALYDEAFGVGGRFYGDTFSDPVTILP